ncbi:polysaccharide lyase beta-sandwich domain-containing protein [Niabella sp. CC-SYL272]|uniref:chondroitinase family polysaccharide lyase n=1 Tax=Niabella agricola TaxID=2891571 RepID=UPI001F390B2D|nr:chondroitinase family polysaccharide lyase [Niabella agricola]MCF3110022.1 polysaccharide lyase beta-sandwich domain-containing protein [Niabella agricola]
MNKNIKTVFALLIAVSAYGPLQAQPKETAATKVITGQYGFETGIEQEGWKAQNSRLSFSTAHYKEGGRSLCWTWGRNASLEITGLKGLKEAGAFYSGGIPEIYEPSFYPKDRFGGMKVWLYQEQPVKGQLVFQAGSSQEAARQSPKYRFTVNMDFTGWRTVWVCFDEDAKVPDYKGSDDLQALVVIPKNVPQQESKLFIDHLTLLRFVSNKRSSDVQFENKKRNLRSADGYEILKPYRAFQEALFRQKADKAALAETSQKIAARLEFLILGDQTTDWKERNTGIETLLQGKLKAARNLYDQLKIKRVNGAVNGVPLFAIRDEHPAPEGQVFDNVAQNLLFPLAADYRLNGTEQSKEQLLNALDYFLDQGWAAGSAIGTVDHVIRLTPIATAIFLMRDELKTQNKLMPQVNMLIWHTRMGGLLELDATRGENSDKVRGGAMVKLITILLMENDAPKQQLLQQFKAYMNYVAGFAPGYSDTFKPDYSIYHHRGTYLNAYGTNAVNTMALIHWLLDGTSYAMDAASTRNLTAALKQQAAIAYGVQIHYGVSGRFPLNNSSIDGNSMPAFAYMSMSGDSIRDPELAALYNYIYAIAKPDEINKMLLPALTYSGTYGTLNLMVRLHRKMGAARQIPADGVTVMPYSGLLTYRRGNAFATVKGYNKYIWDYEGGKGENNMGRYLSHGMLITAQGDEKEGFDSMGMALNEGFDWSMLPGATTKKLPADKMLYDPQADQKYVEGKHRNFSESVIASGLKQGLNGLFALDLRDDVFPDADRSLFDHSFRAKKTYFFIDDEIICLGSNISNKDHRYATVTTLFQYRAGDKHLNYFNGKVITSQPVQTADGGYFTDQNGLHYIIPKGQRASWVQGTQQSYQWKNASYTPIEGTYLKAWLDHGAQPVAGGYEYEILLHGQEPERYLQTKTYTVLQKDHAAHSIRHKASGITAYAVFEPNGLLKGGLLLKTDAPLLVQVKETNSRLLLTVAGPDIGQSRWNHNMSHMPDSITNAWAKGRVITLTLKGAWYGTEPVSALVSSTVKNGNTILSVFCKDGESIDLPLQHRGAGTAEEE